MKQRLRIALAFAVACTMLFTASAGYGEGGSIPTYEVFPQKLNDPGYIMERGMGGVKLEMTPSEGGAVLDSGYIEGYQLTLDSRTGCFYFLRPGTYPHIFGLGEMDRAWLSDEDKMRLSDEPGLYTPEEAAEAGLQFLRDVMGMDTSCLYAREIMAGEAAKERSCVYQIKYAYRVPEMRVGWWSTLDIEAAFVYMWITDSGVDEVRGRAVSFAPYGEVAREDILAYDTIADLAQNPTPPELMYLPLQREGKEVLSPVWGIQLDVDNPRGYDALTGEKLLDLWDVLP